jgi:hypothetical protein
MLFLGACRKGKVGPEAPVMKGGAAIDWAQICRQDLIPEHLSFLYENYPDQVKRWLAQQSLSRPMSPPKQDELPHQGPAPGVTKIVKVQSHSDASKMYKVRFHSGGGVSCDCVGFGYRGRCRHPAEAMEQLRRNPEGFEAEVEATE